MENKLLYPELSYELRGMLFSVHNELGRYRNEKQYGDAFELRLQTSQTPYKRELVLPESFPGEHKGRNRIDFLIADIIVVELKSVMCLSRDDYFQCQRYLAALNLEPAFLVNFRPKYLVIRRILNPHRLNKNP